MGQCGLDLNAPCCRGVIHGDPAQEATNTLSRLMLNAFLAMMVMVLSLALYSDFFYEDWGKVGQSVRSILQHLSKFSGVKFWGTLEVKKQDNSWKYLDNGING